MMSGEREKYSRILLAASWMPITAWGFYCTRLKKQAIRWALTRNGASVVNQYSYTPDEGLSMLCFDEMTDEGCIENPQLRRE